MRCVFCELNDETIHENEWVVAFFDRYPVTKGHVLIVPKRHVESYFDMQLKERQAIDEALFTVKRYLDETHQPEGYNVGMNLGEHAGQTVAHAHVHLIPRYAGDVEDPRGGVRAVIPARQRY